MNNEGGMCSKSDLPFTNLAEHLTTHRGGQAMTPPRDQQSEAAALEASPRPWKVHRTGDKLSLTDANGKFVFRKVVSTLPSIESYNRLLADFHAIAEAVNRAALTAHDEAREHLGNLLAIIHGDGGHYQAEHGNEKATTDAIAKYYELRARHDEALTGEPRQRFMEMLQQDFCGILNESQIEHFGKMAESCFDAAHNSAMRLLVDELRNIAEADTSKWDKECRSDADFKAWAQNRARHRLQPYSGQKAQQK